MNSFNNVKKYIYNTDQNEYVKLLEYAICTNQSNAKYIVFKFKNLIVQDLYAITFKISQYDSNQNLLKTSSISYDGFLAHSGEEFVPNAKYRALQECETIIVELEEAVFEKMRYRYGVCTDIVLDEEKLLKTKDTIVKPKQKKTKKMSKKMLKYKYKIKAQKKLRSKFTLSTTIFLSLLLIGFVIYGAIMIQKLRYPFLYQSVLYEEMSDGTLSVIGYDGKSKKIEIPATVNDKSVSLIKSEAFKDNDTMRELVIEADRLIIDTNSFTNCTSLNSVTISGEATIHSYAFKDCFNLRSFDASSTNLDQYAFENVTRLDTLIFKSSVCHSFGDIFGLNNRFIPDIVYVSFDIPIVSASFLRNIPSNYSQSYENRNEDSFYEQDYFENGFRYYILNDTAHIYDYTLMNDIIEVPETLGKHKVSQIDSYAFYGLQCKKILISSSMIIESSAVVSCNNLKEIEVIGSDVVIYSDSFYSCNNVISFIATQLELNEGILTSFKCLENLEFGRTSVKKLGDLFGVSNDDIPTSLKNVTVQFVDDPEIFFKNIDFDRVTIYVVNG